MKDLDQKIIELMDLFDDEQVTTADQIKRPEKALEKQAIDDFMKRNPMAGGGMLVQPGFGGVRQGYAKDKKKINRDESYRKVVKDFTATSGPGTGKIFDDPAAIEIVKANLNKIKKQRNNKALFEWSEDSDWYRKLRKELNPNTKTGTNREYTNKLINQVVDEFFPGAYNGKNAIKNFRNDMVVKSFIQHLKSVGEFDGQEKFDKVLDQFTYKKDGKRKSADHLYEDINRSWKSWINGEFEVDGVDRAQLKKELKARGIDYSQIDNWKAAQTQKRGTEKIAEIKFLNNQNSKFPNRSLEQVKELFKKKFPNGNFALRVNNLTEIKRNGVYISGANSERSITGIDKGDRAGWLKKAYGKQFAGNYSKIINAADELTAAGETAKAERLYKAADKFFGPTGIVRKSAVGEAEHALARSFDFLNPDRQLAINSIVDGDLNQFKKNLFDIPVKRYFDEYNNPNTTKARRVELKNLIEERKKIMNAITGGQKSGIVAGDIVNFRYGANEITATSSVKPIDTLFKEGKFNIDDYIERGNKYTEAFQAATKDIDVKKDFSTPINENKLKTLLASFGDGNCPVTFGKKKKDGGRIGYQTGTPGLNQCIESGIKNFNDGKLKTADQVQDAAKLLNGGRRVLSGLMKYGVVPELAFVGLEATGKSILGEKPLDAIKKSIDTFTFGLTDFTSDIEAEKFGKFGDLKLDVDKYRNSLAKVNSIQQDIANLETLNTGSQFGYEGDQTEAIQMKKVQLEAAKKELQQNMISPDKVSVIDRMADNIADAQMAKSAFAKQSLKDQMDGIPGVADYMDTEPGRMFPKQPSQTELNLNMLPSFKDYQKSDQGQIDRTILNAPDEVLQEISPDALNLKKALQEEYKMENLKDTFGAEQIYGTQGVFSQPLAGGGIAKMAGDRSGAMLTSMNPDSQGLSGLLKRGIKT
jgi:hypothetical protein